MKKLFSIIALTLTMTASAQTFDGVFIGGDLKTCVNAFKAKGYRFEREMEVGGAVVSGMIAGRSAEIMIFVTPKSEKVCKISVYFDEETSWYSLKASYNKYVGILADKYGQPDEKFAVFLAPYSEGDGYEMSAVKLDKCRYAAVWVKKENLSILVQISKWAQVNLQYENDEMMELKDREEKQKTNVIF